MTNLLLDQILSSKGRIKILRILLEHTELSISQIATLTKLNHNSVGDHLTQLVRLAVLQEKVFGRIKVYRLCLEDPKVQAIKGLFILWEDNVSTNSELP